MIHIVIIFFSENRDMLPQGNVLIQGYSYCGQLQVNLSFEKEIYKGSEWLQRCIYVLFAK